MRLRNCSAKNVTLERRKRLPFEGILVVSRPSSTCFSMTPRATDLCQVGGIRRLEALDSKRIRMKMSQVLARTKQSQQYRMAIQSGIPFHHLLLERYRQQIQEHVPNPHYQSRHPSTQLRNLRKDTSMRRQNQKCDAGPPCRQISPGLILRPLLPRG